MSEYQEQEQWEQEAQVEQGEVEEQKEQEEQAAQENNENIAAPVLRKPKTQKMEAAELIRNARIKAGWTQEQLGNEIGYKGAMAQAYICRIENGSRKVPRDKIEKMASKLKLKIKDLL